MVQITATVKGRPIRVLQLSTGEILIGRDPSNHVVLEDPAVSAHHARLVAANGKMILADWKSEGGTYLNGARITAPMVFRCGDKVVVGECVITAEPAIEPDEWSVAEEPSAPLPLAQAPGDAWVGHQRLPHAAPANGEPPAGPRRISLDGLRTPAMVGDPRGAFSWLLRPREGAAPFPRQAGPDALLAAMAARQGPEAANVLLAAAAAARDQHASAGSGSWFLQLDVSGLRPLIQVLVCSDEDFEPNPPSLVSVVAVVEGEAWELARGIPSASWLLGATRAPEEDAVATARTVTLLQGSWTCTATETDLGLLLARCTPEVGARLRHHWRAPAVHHGEAVFFCNDHDRGEFMRVRVSAAGEVAVENLGRGFLMEWE